jgi:hypothetical protein
MAYATCADNLFTSAPISHVLYPNLDEASAIQATGIVGLIVRYPWCGSETTRQPIRFGGSSLYSSLVTDKLSIEVPPHTQLDGSAGGGNDSELPPWTAEALTRLIQLQALPTNWDSYGGLPLSDRHARLAWRFLEKVMRDGLPLPDFVPLADGGLQLEWGNDAVALSFTTEDGAMPSLWLSTPTENREVGLEALPRVSQLVIPPSGAAD